MKLVALRLMYIAVILSALCLSFISPVSEARPDSWSEGLVAAETSQALVQLDPVPVEIPSPLVEGLADQRVLFYFSPTCPHCQNVVPEINALIKASGLEWLGVASAGAAAEELAQFKAEFKPDFDWWLDTEGAFAKAVGARTTPTVTVIQKRSADGAEPAQSGMSWVDVTAFYSPFSRGMSSLFLMRQDTAQPFKHFSGYIGDMACGVCHQTEGTSWALSHHAIAYRTIYMAERTDDEACVKCHVTGMGEPGGFELGDHASNLAGVTCEACHGPSGPHDGATTEATSTCAGCHDKEHSIAFSVEKGLPHIDHYLSASLSPTETQNLFSKLISGEAERPLLAFPDGPSAGAEACRECHGAEHRSWSKQHGRAMGKLSAEDAQNAECVACHATQNTYGLGVPTAAVTDFRTDEGVGCEACHGPGTAHIDAPSAGTIVGLGDSCPECILEAVCTTCHTPRWDPDWSLETRMDQLSHGDSR
jgi:hypothetical protein